jgi:class 3 adenylate cyclase
VLAPRSSLPRLLRRNQVADRRSIADPRSAFATILLTDIVESTSRAADLGNRGWRRLLDAHDATSLEVIERFGGSAAHHTGDGFLAIFQHPEPAIACALAVRQLLADLSLGVRAGLHAGGLTIRATDVAGINVHIAARVTAVAGPGEVLVTGAVRCLSASTGRLVFESFGPHRLKGVPEAIELWRVRLDPPDVATIVPRPSASVPTATATREHRSNGARTTGFRPEQPAEPAAD